MKIAIDISQIPYGTGVSNYTKNLVESLLTVDKKNDYLLFATSFRQKKKLEEFINSLPKRDDLDVKILSLPISIARILLGKLRIFPIEKYIGFDVDVFHSSDWIEPKVKSNNLKKVTTVHDMTVYLFPTSIHPKIVSAQKTRLNLVKKESSIIIADSQTTKEDMVKFLDIDENKIKVIYLAASPIFKPQDDDKVKEILEKYKIKKPYILSVATQEPRKNIQKLLDAFAKIRETRTQVNLVLSGKYGWGPGLHTPENVIFTDYVPEDDLAALYSGCRVFAYPSLYEGFGLPILEAMACGTPVITSNNSSMAEIAKGTAILIDPRSEGQLKKAIELVLDLNLENYQKLVRASLENARKFSWTKTARETLKVYEEVAKKADSQISDEQFSSNS